LIKFRLSSVEIQSTLPVARFHRRSGHATTYKLTRVVIQCVNVQHNNWKRKELRRLTCYSSRPKDDTRLQRMSITALTALTLGAADASAGEVPQYELTGFPISPLQMSVVRSDGIQEQSPTPALTLGGMPASPHQIAVTSPRTKQQVAHRLKTDASRHQHADN
jgi:hypothetical protein